MTDSDTDTEASQTAEIVTPRVSFVLTVTADENSITVTSTAPTNTCPAFSTCSFVYLFGTTLTIKTPARNLPDCEQFTNWLGICGGQGATCTTTSLGGDISTTAVFGPIPGCIPK